MLCRGDLEETRDLAGSVVSLLEHAREPSQGCAQPFGGFLSVICGAFGMDGAGSNDCALSNVVEDTEAIRSRFAAGTALSRFAPILQPLRRNLQETRRTADDDVALKVHLWAGYWVVLSLVGCQRGVPLEARDRTRPPQRDRVAEQTAVDTLRAEVGNETARALVECLARATLLRVVPSGMNDVEEPAEIQSIRNALKVLPPYSPAERDHYPDFIASVEQPLRDVLAAASSRADGSETHVITARSQVAASRAFHRWGKGPKAREAREALTAMDEAFGRDTRELIQAALDLCKAEGRSNGVNSSTVLPPRGVDKVRAANAYWSDHYSPRARAPERSIKTKVNGRDVRRKGLPSVQEGDRTISLSDVEMKTLFDVVWLLRVRKEPDRRARALVGYLYRPLCPLMNRKRTNLSAMRLQRIQKQLSEQLPPALRRAAAVVFEPASEMQRFVGLLESSGLRRAQAWEFIKVLGPYARMPPRLLPTVGFEPARVERVHVAEADAHGETFSAITDSATPQGPAYRAECSRIKREKRRARRY